MLTNSKEPGKSRSSWLRSTFQKETQLREDTIIPKREKPSLSNHKAEMPSLSPARKKKKKVTISQHSFTHLRSFPRKCTRRGSGMSRHQKDAPPPPPRPARFPRSPASDHATPHPAALPHFRPGRSFPPRSAAAARGLTLPRPGHTPGRPPAPAPLRRGATPPQGGRRPLRQARASPLPSGCPPRP